MIDYVKARTVIFAYLKNTITVKVIRLAKDIDGLEFEHLDFVIDEIFNQIDKKEIVKFFEEEFDLEKLELKNPEKLSEFLNFVDVKLIKKILKKYDKETYFLKNLEKGHNIWWGEDELILGQCELSEILKTLEKLTKTDVTVSECKKRIENRELNIVCERKEINYMEPNLISSFFIKNIELVIDREDISENNPLFDLDLIVCLKNINNNSFELVDFNNQKLRLPKNKVRAKMKEAPLENFLNLIN